MKTAYSQAAVRIPAKQEAHREKEKRGHGGKRQVKERFALQKQAPVCCFIPAWKDGVKDPAQSELHKKRYPLQVHVCGALVVVIQGIIRNGTYRLPEDSRVLKVLARQKTSPGVLHDHVVSRVDYNPAPIEEHFGNHMFRVAVRTQQEQAPYD